MPRRLALAAATVLAATAAGACGDDDLLSGKLPDAPQTVKLTSTAFRPGGELPARFTCDGAGKTPPLRWTGVPPEAQQLVLIVTDPDVPERRYVHWTLYGLPAQLSSLPEGAPSLAGAEQGRNSAGKNGWTAPCPERGAPAHRYEFDLYWLERPLELGSGADGDALLLALEDVAGGRGRLVARYARPQR
jgi:Raf kinase inhibitor-like YbhB/YbcL family protein